ncbi:hemerythrin domain-containing protein [Streptomyces peucetius]|uniref:Hemerythrin domain-containing protein n=1 Tax=Streptomyces peucetius TaxID=1950 RepID=A0ABY6IKA5_STRPE|nr:hemerythrin domain-containing protein [Streptomyces peucetius]UYQ66334.1 hemerythrin domain-containing protein [Streptomyces peucetius]
MEPYRREEAPAEGKPGGADLIDELVTAHREVELLFRLQASLPSGDRRRREVADEVLFELVSHAVTEEHNLYPAVRDYLEGGGELADKELEDHAKIERLLKDLEDLSADDPRFDSLVSQLMLDVMAHFRDEEQQLFPALRLACPAEILTTLGAGVRRAKERAPTRPHPSAPDTPSASKLLAPGAGLVDRVRSLYSGPPSH